VGHPLRLLGDALGREPLDGFRDAGVQDALPVVEQPPVRDFVGERVLERVLLPVPGVDLLRYPASIWSLTLSSASATKATSLPTPPALMWPAWRT
jgi:hypothetical protein